MKKIICLLLSFFTLNSCTYLNDVGDNETEDITITIKDNTVSPTSLTLIIENHSDKDYSFDNYFTIEKKENDRWSECEIISAACPSTLPLYYNKNDLIKMEQDWSCQYGRLSSGDYHLIKSVTYKEDVYELSTKFTLN